MYTNIKWIVGSSSTKNSVWRKKSLIKWYSKKKKMYNFVFWFINVDKTTGNFFNILYTYHPIFFWKLYLIMDLHEHLKIVWNLKIFREKYLIIRNTRKVIHNIGKYLIVVRVVKCLAWLDWLLVFDTNNYRSFEIGSKNKIKL